MRQIGRIDNQNHAQMFAWFLQSKGIACQVEPDDDGWAIWVVEEDHVGPALRELDAFLADPTNPQYQRAAGEARRIREEEEKRQREAQRRIIQMKRIWSRPAVHAAPLTITLIVLSVAVSLITRFGNPRPNSFGAVVADQLRFLSRTHDNAADPNPMASVMHGQVWRLVTPIFLHLDVIHLLFNMYVLYYLGTAVERVTGTPRYGLFVLVAAVLSCAAQAMAPEALGGSPNFGGMSGVGYALFGYLWMKTLFQPELGIHLSQFTIFVLLAWLVLCMLGLFGPIANVAHVVGLVVGVLWGYLPLLWRE